MLLIFDRIDDINLSEHFKTGLGDDRLHLNKLMIGGMINGNRSDTGSEEEKAAAQAAFDRFIAAWRKGTKPA